MTEQQIERIKKHIGRPPKFGTADDLLQAAMGYFKECDANPFQVRVRDKKRVKTDGGKQAEKQLEEVPRPYTLDGLCLYCGIFMSWATFKNNCKRRTDAQDFEIVIHACEQTIRDQQIAGALINLYDSRLVARLNGITDNTEVNVNARQTSLPFEEYVKLLRGEGAKP